MSASAAPPNRSRCRGTPARSAQDPNPAATPLCPCDIALPADLPAAALKLAQRRRSWTSSGNGRFRSLGPQIGQIGKEAGTPRRPLQVWVSQGRVWGMKTHFRRIGRTLSLTQALSPRAGRGDAAGLGVGGLLHLAEHLVEVEAGGLLALR